jgi:probable phosphoglycerate mutase
MTVFHLVRHAQTVWHRENRYAGVSDIDLTPEGLAQAERFALWAAGTGLAAVVSSDLRRAVLSAQPSARAAGKDLRVVPSLREVGFGQGEGLTADEMHSLFPERLAAFYRQPASNPLPGGENGHVACERAMQSLLDLAHEFPGKEVLVVTHSTLLRLVVARVLGVPLDEYRRAMPVVASMSVTTVELPSDWDTLRNAPRHHDHDGVKPASLLSFNAPAWSR